MFNLNNNRLFGYLASSGAIAESLFAGASSQTIYRDFVSSRQVNGSAPFRIGPDIKFQRLSTASYYNSGGIIVYAGNNEARFDYSPSGTYRGLLIEEARTNSFKYSIDFTQTDTWTVPTSTNGAGVTLTTVTTVSAPDNSLTVTLLSGRPAVGFRCIVGESNVSTGGEDPTNYCRSIFIKQNVGRYALIGVNNPTAQIPVNFGVQNFRIFDFEEGNFVSTVDGGGALRDNSDQWLYVEEHPNDWYRIGAIRPSTNTVINKFYVGTALTSTWDSGFYINQNNRDSFYIWGGQYERGDCITSYIPTSGQTVTRAPDSVTTIRLSAFNVYNIQEGSLFVRGSRLSTFLPGSFATFAQTNNQYWKLGAETPFSVGLRSVVTQGIYLSFPPNTDFSSLTSTPYPISNTPYTLIGAVSSNFETTMFYYGQDETYVPYYPLSTEYQTWTNTLTNTNLYSISGTWPIYNGPNQKDFFAIYIDGVVQPVSSYFIDANNRTVSFFVSGFEENESQLSGVQLVKEYVSFVGIDPRPTTFRLGQQFNSEYLNGHIQEFGYWPIYLPFNTLSALVYPTP
jgi:hypothetical protein